MIRVGTETKHSIKKFQWLMPVGILTCASIPIEWGYSLLHGYSIWFAIVQIVLFMASLTVLLIGARNTGKFASNEAYIKAIMKHSQEGIIIFCHKGEIEFVNDRAKQLFFQHELKEVKDIYEACLFSTMDGTPIAPQDNPMAQALRGETVHNYQLCITYEGKDIYLFVNAISISDKTVVVFHEITEYKALERANIKRIQTYRSLAEYTSDLFLTWDVKWNVIYASPSYRTLVGFEHVKYMEQPALIHVHPADLAHLQEALERLLNEKRGMQIEFRFLHADGYSVFVDAKVEPVLDQFGEVENVVLFARDITTKKKEEKLLQGQNKVLSLIAREAAWEEVLTAITQQIETLHKNVICGITILNINHLIHISPALPAEVLDAIRANLTGKPAECFLHAEVLVRDVMDDPILLPVADWLSIHEYTETWYRPIHTSEGKAIGVMSLTYRQPMELQKVDVALCDAYAQIVAMAMERNQSKREIEYLAYHDPLTGLHNRRVIERIFHEMDGTVNSARQCSVMLLDIDRFKWINDTFGHDTGDQVIQTIANRLVGCVGKNDLVSRIGGDEFTIILRDSGLTEEAIKTGQRILRNAQETIMADGHEFNITTSIGIAFYPEHGTNLHELLKNADTAMYDAKSKGRNMLSVYTLQMNEKFHDKLFLERDIRRAIENKDFTLYYQPKVHIGTKCITGAEALIRWPHPTRGFVSPGEFIPVAEEMGVIFQIGEWVLETVFQQLHRWAAEGKPWIPIAVNISAQQLVKPTFTAIVREGLRRYNLAPEQLELEITETSMMTNVEIASKNIFELSQIGVGIILDDFGTGYASLSYLARFEIRSIKIDRSFVDGLLWRDGTSENIVMSIISLAQSLGKKVIAEGVEMEEQLQFLKDRYCDEAQGYLFSRPVPIHELEALLLKDVHQKLRKEHKERI